MKVDAAVHPARSAYVPFLYISFPVGLVLAGAIRELAFPFLSTQIQSSVWSGALYIIVLYGGLGSLLAILAKELAGKLTASKQARIDLLEETLIGDAPLRHAGMMARGMASNLGSYIGVLERTYTAIAENKKNQQSISAALLLQEKCIQQTKKFVTQCINFIVPAGTATKERRPFKDIVEDAVELARLLANDNRLKIDCESADAPRDVKLNDLSLMHGVVTLIRQLATLAGPVTRIRVCVGIQVRNAIKYATVTVIGEGSIQLQRTLFAYSEALRNKGKEPLPIELMMVKRLIEADEGEVIIASSQGKFTSICLRYRVDPDGE